jgi:hypothetical protein
VLDFLADEDIELIDEAEAEEREAARRSFQRKLDSNRLRLERVRICQTIPEGNRLSSRTNHLLECGYVYLIPRGNMHKIGKTDRMPRMRRREIERQLKSFLTMVVKYPTVIPLPLEQALHRHFDEFRIRREVERQKGERKHQKGELFRLPPEEVERWVLIAEEARLELEILRMEAEHERHSSALKESSKPRM